MTSSNRDNILKPIKTILAVSSCKGGVGKSTVAGYIALELTKQGHKVGILDADIYGPSLPSLFDTANVKIKTDSNKRFLPIDILGIQCMSFGFLLGDAPAVMRGPLVTRYLQQMLFNTTWGELDYLLIDMPPGTGDIQLTITQQAQIDGAIIVTTPQTLSLVDVARGILMFEKVSVPIWGIVENMAYFQCDGCEKRHNVFGDMSSQMLQKRFGVEILGEIPLAKSINQPLSSSMNLEPIEKVVKNIMLAKENIGKRKNFIPGIRFDEDNIKLTWPDGGDVAIKNRTLREHCQCALCVHELSGKKLLKPKEIPSNIKPINITPLGNYALGIQWSDGHSSGIYSYDLIRTLVKDSLQNT